MNIRENILSVVYKKYNIIQYRIQKMLFVWFLLHITHDTAQDEEFQIPSNPPYKKEIPQIRLESFTRKIKDIERNKLHESLVFQLFSYPSYYKQMFDKNSRPTINSIIDTINTSTIPLKNNKINKLYDTFCPPFHKLNGNIPQNRAIYYGKIIPIDDIHIQPVLTNDEIAHDELVDNLIINSLQNLLFCQIIYSSLQWWSWVDGKNKFSYNNKEYAIYLTTLIEDKKWVDIMLYNATDRKVIWIDLSTDKTDIQKKAKENIPNWYDQYKTLYLWNIKKAIQSMIDNYMVYLWCPDKAIPNLKSSHLKKAIIQLIDQNNTPLSLGPDTDNNA